MRVFITQQRGKERLVEAFIKAGAEIINTKQSYVKPDLIIPTVDEELPTMAYLREQLPVMCSSEYTIQMCRDKAEFYRFCKRHGFLTPLTMQENMVVKPRFGKASKGIIKLDRSFIVQEDLSELPEVSIDYFADEDGNILSMIPRFRLDILNGESQKAEFIEDMDLSEIKRLGYELGLVGHNVIQGFYTKTQFFFTEVNCRFGGGSHLTFEKFNSPLWLTQHYEQFSNHGRNNSLRS